MTELVESPFASQRAVAQADTAASRQNQSRELAEMQTKFLMAERFPRDPVAAMDRILNAFTRPKLAEKAQYQFARGGSDIAGPSIRAFEAIAQQWGNLEQGFRELQRGVGADGKPFSEVEAFCWDLQGRNHRRIQFFVPHWRDTKRGGYQLTDERDIYELIANQAQRRVRACLQAMIPGDVVDAAMDQAALTLRTTADCSAEAMQKMVAAFEPFGVTKDQIEKRIQRRLDAIQPAQVVSLKRIYASLRDDMSAPSDWFEFEEGAAPPPPAPKALDAMSAEHFTKNEAGWKQTVQSGKKTADALIAMLSTKHALSDAQKAAIKAFENFADASPMDGQPAAAQGDAQ